MSSFTVRVELKGYPAASTYQALHDAMNRSGFSRRITSSDGKQYHMLPAEYDYSSEATAAAVRDEAYAIASRVYDNPAVFVTTAGARAWQNLDSA